MHALLSIDRSASACARATVSLSTQSNSTADARHRQLVGACLTRFQTTRIWQCYCMPHTLSNSTDLAVLLHASHAFKQHGSGSATACLHATSVSRCSCAGDRVLASSSCSTTPASSLIRTKRKTGQNLEYKWTNERMKRTGNQNEPASPVPMTKLLVPLTFSSKQTWSPGPKTAVGRSTHTCRKRGFTNMFRFGCSGLAGEQAYLELV